MKLLITLTLLFSLSLSVDVWKSFVNEEGLEMDVSSLQGTELDVKWQLQKGGAGGGPFSDDCEKKGGLSQIKVECGRYVGMVALKCKNSPVFNTERGKGWGSGNASGDKKHTFDASQITLVKIRAGSYVDRIEFYAGATAKFKCGGNHGGSWYTATAPSGMVLCGLKGRSGWWMDAIAAGFCWADRDCQVGNFECGACNKALGTHLCKRAVTVTQKANGKPCPDLSESRKCTVNCEQGAFTCGSCGLATGKKHCQRPTIVAPLNGGTACGASTEDRNCDVDCKQGSWNCGSCDSASGKKQCQRNTIQAPHNGGKKCEASAKTEDCPVACKQGSWTCGTCIKKSGEKSCQRPTLITAKNGGTACEASSKTEKCDVDCEQSSWNCGSCDKKSGKKTCSRQITMPAKNNGKACEASAKQDPCPVNCEQTSWTFGTCNKANGMKPGSRSTTVTAKNGGTACGNTSRSDPCPVDCEQTAFTCGSCDKSKGMKKCERKTTVTAKNKGKACGGLTKDDKCAVNCEQTGWTCGTCDKKTGTKKCERKTNVTAKNGGTACGGLTKTEKCPVDCEVGSFTSFGSCDKPCGTGKKTRTRKVTVARLNNGKACPALSENAKCNTQTCVTCPAGSSQLGPYNGDYPGRGLVGHKYNLSTGACFDLCRARSDCGSIHYFAKGGHLGKEFASKTVCELYPTSVKSITKTYGTNSIVCKVPQLTCPSGSSQVGKINGDVGGRGLVGHLKNLSITQCRDKCTADKRCESYHWFPKNGHPGLAYTVCELYKIGDFPSGTYGNNSIVCKSKCCAYFYQHCNYGGWKRRECADNTWIGSSHNDNLSSLKVDSGCKVTLYQHSNYNGKKVGIKGNVSCLVNYKGDGINNWNDIVSSWKIGRGLSFKFSALTEEEMAVAEAQFVEEFENDAETSFISTPIIGFGAIALVGVGAYIFKQRQTTEYEELIDDV